MKFSEYKITDKNAAYAYGEHYYDKLIEKWQGRSFNFLEMGVQFGPSILAFAQTLPNAKIHGIDVDLSRNRYQEQQEATGRVTLHEIDLYAPTTAGIVKEKLGMIKFDIIVDDADHTVRSQIQAFKVFFPRLNVGGTYIIEDVMDIKELVEGLKPYARGATIEVVDLRNFHNKLTDDVLIVVDKFSRPILLL